MNILKKILAIMLTLLCQSVLAMEDSKKKADSKVILSKVDQELLAAAAGANEEAIRKALKAGANVNVQDDQGETALHKVTIALSSSAACVLLERPPIIKLLMQAGADCTIEDNTDISLLNELGDPYKPISQIITIAPSVLQNMHCTAVMAHDPQKSLKIITGKAAYAALNNSNDKTLQDQYYSLVTDSLCAGSDTINGICLISGTPYDFMRYFGDNKRMEEVLSAFQKKHQEQVQQSIGLSLAPELYPLIFECLYWRPQAGIMTGYCKDLLTMPLSTSGIADYVLEKFERFSANGGFKVRNNIITDQDKQGNTALHLAIKQGNIRVVKWMQPHIINPKDMMELYQLARQEGQNEIAHHYSKAISEDINRAINQGDDTAVMNLISSGASLPIDHMKYLQTSLITFAEWVRDNEGPREKQFEIVKILCAAGIDIDEVFDLSPIPWQTCLESAIGFGLPEVVKLFLYLGVDGKRPNSKTHLIPWQQTTNESMQQLLQFPEAINAHLTQAELKEFADIKAERERSLIAHAALYPKAPL